MRCPFIRLADNFKCLVGGIGIVDIVYQERFHNFAGDVIVNGSPRNCHKVLGLLWRLFPADKSGHGSGALGHWPYTVC